MDEDSRRRELEEKRVHAGLSDAEAAELGQLMRAGTGIRGLETPPPPAEAKRSGRSRQNLVASGLIALAGGLAVVSSLFHWTRLTSPRTATLQATTWVGHSKIGLYLGGLLLLRGVLTFSLRDPQARRRWGAFAFIGGGIVGGYAIYDLATERARAISILVHNTAAHSGFSVPYVQAVIDRQVAQGTVRFEFTLGIYLALVAAVLAVAGSFVSRREAGGTGSEWRLARLVDHP